MGENCPRSVTGGSNASLVTHSLHYPSTAYSSTSGFERISRFRGIKAVTGYIFFAASTPKCQHSTSCRLTSGRTSNSSVVLIAQFLARSSVRMRKGKCPFVSPDFAASLRRRLGGRTSFIRVSCSHNARPPLRPTDAIDTAY